MSSTRLVRIRGDSAELTLNATNPLTGATFDLSTMLNVIFTAKRNLEDTDAEAVFQKELGVGIAVAAAVATVEVTYLDTEDLDGRATTLFCDLQAQDSAGEVTTVWSGTITFKADVTRGVDPAVAINTLQPVTARFMNLTDVVGLTGGGDTKLDGQATKSGGNTIIVTGTVALLSYGRAGQWWKLIAGTDAESPGTGVVRPDDYDGSTNARIWVQL